MKTFISYCFDDEDFVKRVSYYLHDQSSIVPYCYGDEKRHEGWAEQIQTAMTPCAAFVLFVGSRLGDTQHAEARHAQSQEPRLKLVRVSLPGSSANLPLDLPQLEERDPVQVHQTHRDSEIDEVSAQRCARDVCKLLMGNGAWRPQFGIPDGYPFSYEKVIIEEFVRGNGKLDPDRLEQGCPHMWPYVEHSDGRFINPVDEKIIGEFKNYEDHIFVDARMRHHARHEPRAAQPGETARELTFAEARPRKMLRYPDPRELAANFDHFSVGIVVSGGIAPGINSVIAGIVGRHMLYESCYRERNRSGNKRGYRLNVFGFRDGFKSLLTDGEPPRYELSREPRLAEVLEKSSRGGSILGTCRLEQLLYSANPKERAAKFEDMVRSLRSLGVRILYVIGGDGTMRAAHALRIAAKTIDYPLTVAAIPKTMDNDILWVWQSFGFLSAVEKAREFIMQVHTEASSNPRVCVMQLFGSDSGFVVSHAAHASGVVNLALIPEIKFNMQEVCAYMQGRLLDHFEQGRSPYGVVVMSETAIPTDVERYLNDPDVKLEQEEKDEILKFMEQRRVVRGQTPDALRTGGLKIVSRVLQRELRNHPQGYWENLRVFTNEPRHLLRSLEPSAADIIFGQRLGCLAVDNAMAGFNDFMVSQWMTEFVLVPLELVVLGRKRVPPNGIFWRSVLASTGQPSDLTSSGVGTDPVADALETSTRSR